METPKQVGARLQELRLRAGKPSYATIAKRIYRESDGLVDVSDQTISNYHQGKTGPVVMNLEIVRWIAKVYECAVADISATCARREELSLVSVGTSPRPNEPGGIKVSGAHGISDEVEHTTRWIDASAGRAA